MRRWVRVVLGVAIVVVVFHLAGGWYFSGVIHDRALSGVDRRASTDFDPDLTVAAIDGDTIVLRASEGSDVPPSLSLDGMWGLRWANGYGQVGDVLRENEDGVARTFQVLDGEDPEAGDGAQLDPRAFADPAMAGLEVDDVQIAGPLGSYPAWFVDGDRTTWVIVVHGNSMSRLDNVRWLPALHEAGWPTLTITYRNDRGAPEDPSGLLRYGLTEWEDLDAAVRHALEEGTDDVVLFGDSMGAGVISAFLQRSDLTPYVRAMVFDAPMVDLSRTVDDNAAREPLVGPINVPPTLTWTAKWLTDLRFDVDWEALDYLGDPSIYEVPTLVLHGTDDLTIPIATSEQLAADAPGTVTLIECPGADHIECWNLDPARYEDRVIAFLEAASTS